MITPLSHYGSSPYEVFPKIKKQLKSVKEVIFSNFLVQVPDEIPATLLTWTRNKHFFVIIGKIKTNFSLYFGNSGIDIFKELFLNGCFCH